VPKRNRTRRILLWTGLFLALLIGGTYLVFNVTGLSRSLVRDALSRLISGAFHLDDASVDPFGGTVRLRNFELSEKDIDGKQGRKVLKAPEVVVGVSMNPLGNAGQVHSVVIANPELDLYVGDQKPVDLDALVNISGQPTGPDSATVPALEIQNMTVRLHVPSKRDRFITLTGINLSVRPQADNPQRVSLIGQCRNPFGGEITIEGTGDAEKEQLRALVTSDEFRLDPKQLGQFGTDVVEFVEKHEIGGFLKPVLWLNYPNAKNQLEIGVRSAFRRLSVKPPTFRYKLDELAGTASWEPAEGGTLKLAVAKSAGTELESIEGDIKLDHLDATVGVHLGLSVKGVLVSPKLEHALEGLPDALRIYRGLRPKNGRADLQLFLNSPKARALEEGKTPHVQIDLRLHGVDLDFVGFEPTTLEDRRAQFPYPLTKANGHLRIQDEFVKIHGVDAIGVHGGTVHCEGELNLVKGDKHVDLAIKAKDIPFGKAIRDALAAGVPGGEKIYDDFSPTGTADVTVYVRQKPDDPSSRLETLIYPRGSSLSWRGFPYRIDQVTGNIRVSGDDLQFDLAGLRHPRLGITARGRFRLSDDPDRASSQMLLKATRVPLDENLRRGLRVLKPTFDKQWKLFQPSGMTDIELITWQAPGDRQMSFDLRTDLHDVQARYEDFPIDLSNVRGPVVVHSTGLETKAEILGLTARGAGGNLLITGKLVFGTKSGLDSDALATDLSIVGRDVRLDNKQLIDVLIAKQYMTERVWKLAKASGTVDVIQRIKRKVRDPEGVFQKELILDLREVESRADILPDRLSQLSGRVTIDSERRIHLENVRAKIGEAPLTCRTGQIYQQDGDVFVELNLDAKNYPVDQRLANLLQGKVKAAYLARKPHGYASFTNFGVQMKIPREPPPGFNGLGLELWLQPGSVFRAEELSFESGVRITDLEGRAVIESGYVGPERAEVRGHLNDVSFLAIGQHFSEASGSFYSTHELMSFGSDARVLVHGGVVRGLDVTDPKSDNGTPPPVLVYHFDESGRLETNFSFDDLRLKSMLANLDSTTGYSGSVNGRVRLTVDISDPTTLETQMHIGIRDGNLGAVPIFRSIYSLLRKSKRPKFRAAEVDLRGKDGLVTIDRLKIESSILKLEGKGTLTYDGYVDLSIDFPDLFPEAKDWFILPVIVRWVTNSTVKYDIYGYVGNTKTGPRIPLLGGKPERQPLGPLPGRLMPIPPIFR